MYNTTALAVLHDKIAARLQSRLSTSVSGKEPKTLADFVFECLEDGRRIEMNEPGVIGELLHPRNSITLCLVNR